MKILGIETSCDETACAIVEDGTKVLANVIASQIDIHAKTGGVVPEVAAREHLLQMLPVLDEAFEVAGCGWDDIEAVAVTKGPGLVSSLIMGTQAASVISHVKNKPLIPVQHIIGHLYSNWLESEDDIAFPVLILTVSGGHNDLVLMKGHHDFEVLGETRDDASGEAFDKVARILGLGYPGGPEISRIAENGDVGSFKFPRILLEKDSLDFSFSGLKTAVLTEVKSYGKAGGLSDVSQLDEEFKANVAASFQEAVVETLVAKVERCLKKYPEIREVHLAGGVSANKRLREVLIERIKDVRFRHPAKIAYCTDNAAMIACAGYYLYRDGDFGVANVVPSTGFRI